MVPLIVESIGEMCPECTLASPAEHGGGNVSMPSSCQEYRGKCVHDFFLLGNVRKCMYLLIPSPPPSRLEKVSMISSCWEIQVWICLLMASSHWSVQEDHVSVDSSFWGIQEVMYPLSPHVAQCIMEMCPWIPPVCNINGWKGPIGSLCSRMYKSDVSSVFSCWGIQWGDMSMDFSCWGIYWHIMLIDASLLLNM